MREDWFEEWLNSLSDRKYAVFLTGFWVCAIFLLPLGYDTYADIFGWAIGLRDVIGPSLNQIIDLEVYNIIKTAVSLVWVSFASLFMIDKVIEAWRR